MLNHTVLFKLNDDVSDARRVEAMQRLIKLGQEPGVRSWLVNESIDRRKGRIIIEQAEFTDAATYRAFRTSAAHVEVGEFMREIADWWVGDYEQ